MHDPKIRMRIIVFCILVNVQIFATALLFMRQQIESPWWLVYVVFMAVQAVAVMAAYTLNQPAYEWTVGRLWMRLKIACTALYVTDRKGRRNNSYLQLGSIDDLATGGRCWVFECFAVAFSVGWLPKAVKAPACDDVPPVSTPPIYTGTGADIAGAWREIQKAQDAIFGAASALENYTVTEHDPRTGRTYRFEQHKLKD